jgi:hypothetical protein
MSRHSIASVDRQREDKAGDLPLIGATPSSQQPVNDVDGAWLPRLVGEAVERHMSHKDACFAMGVDKGQLSRQFDGDGHLSAKRVGLLPEAVLIDVADGIKEHYGKGDPRVERRQAAEDAMRAIGRLVAVAVGE